MKVKKVTSWAISGEYTWLQAAEILGMSPRSLRRWRYRMERHGYAGLIDMMRGTPSPRRAPVEEMQRDRRSVPGHVSRLQRAAGYSRWGIRRRSRHRSSVCADTVRNWAASLCRQNIVLLRHGWSTSGSPPAAQRPASAGPACGARTPQLKACWSTAGRPDM
jgi:hypothetical protein